MAIDISVDDLRPFAPTITDARAEAMITGALARASLVAPCLDDEDFAFAEAAKSVLVRAIIRWEDAGAGNVTHVSRGPFSETRSTSRELFWPSEIAELQNLCRSSEDGDPLGASLPQWVAPTSPYDDTRYMALWER